MSLIKTPKEMKLIAEGGRLMGEILEKLAAMVSPGVSAWDIDQAAEKMIRDAGGRPAFKGYKPRSEDVPFPSTICASLNEELVHGIATPEKILHEGDIFSIDIGMEYPYRPKTGKRGYFTDTAVTIPVGDVPETIKKMIRVAERALEAGIEQCRPGNSIADIGKAIQLYVESQGSYGIVRDLVGHGVGHEPHEDPPVPNYYTKSLERWILKPGVVIAIEPMISLGSHRIEIDDRDHWTIRTADQSLSAHAEHTIIVTDDGNCVATRRPHEML